MRNIVDVMNEMRPYIEKKELLDLFDKVERDVPFTAPEAMYLRWNQLSSYLSSYIPAPLKNDNEVKVVSIFTTMTEEEVRNQFMEVVK